MPRPSRDNRERIVSGAQTFFARYGLSKTTIDDIARAVRMGKSSLYYYFKSKEEIFQAVLDREILLLKGRLVDAVAQAQSPQEKLKAYFLVRMTAVKEVANLYSVFKDEYLRNYAFVQRIREGYDKYEIELIRGILAQGVAKGLFSIKDIDLTSNVILAAMKGLEYEWATTISETEIARNIGKLADVLFYGIVRR